MYARKTDNRQIYAHSHQKPTQPYRIFSLLAFAQNTQDLIIPAEVNMVDSVEEHEGLESDETFYSAQSLVFHHSRSTKNIVLSCSLFFHFSFYFVEV